MSLAPALPVAPAFLLHARHAADVWSARPLITSEWYIPLGHPTPAGLMVHHQLHAWPSPAHRRLWWHCRYGCSAAVIDHLSSSDFSLLFDEDSLWGRQYFLNLFAAFLYTRSLPLLRCLALRPCNGSLYGSAARDPGSLAGNTRSGLGSFFPILRPSLP